LEYGSDQAVCPGNDREEGFVKAFAIDEFGGPGSIHEVPVPEPAEGQVLVRVAAAGVNPFDNAVLQGYLKDHMEHRFPLVPGMDAAGTVDAVGEGVDALAVGDRVFGSVGKPFLGEGTLAQFVAMSAATVARTPDALDDTVAAAIPTAGVTAVQIADGLALQDGHVVVALGATGGVGTYFVQLASMRGARVVAVCSAANADYARELGAADAIDYAAGDVAAAVRAKYPDGIDAVAGMHGDPETLSRLAEQVRSGGRVASAVGGVDVEALAGRGIQGANVMGRATTASLDQLATMLTAKQIVAPPLTTFAFADAAKAFESVGSGHTRGKIVVTVA
jgi:NADPH:quinone reductase-like Zn-dependent oxidoreductase